MVENGAYLGLHGHMLRSYLGTGNNELGSTGALNGHLIVSEPQKMRNQCPNTQYCQIYEIGLAGCAIAATNYLENTVPTVRNKAAPACSHDFKDINQRKMFSNFQFDTAQRGLCTQG